MGLAVFDTGKRGLEGGATTFYCILIPGLSTFVFELRAL